MESNVLGVYSKTKLNAAPLNAIAVLRGSNKIPINCTLYMHLLYTGANETAMHKPKVVHYIATVYIIYLFQHSFVSLSRIKIATVFCEVEMYFHV